MRVRLRSQGPIHIEVQSETPGTRFRTLIPGATAHSASIFNAFRRADITIHYNYI